MTGLLQRIFKRNIRKYDCHDNKFYPELIGRLHTQEEIDAARKSEEKIQGYIPLCGYIFLKTAMGEVATVSSENPNMGDLDKMVVIRIKAAQLAYGHTYFVHCNQDCPGYTPIPVDDFSIGRDIVICKRIIPEPIVPNDTVEEWEELRQKARALNIEEIL